MIIGGFVSSVVLLAERRPLLKSKLVEFLKGITMLKKLLIGASLLASVAAMAADVASASAAQIRSNDKKSQALQCQQQAAEKKLEGAELKSFLVKCLNPAAAKVVSVAPAK